MNSGISENCRNFALENQRRAPQDATIPHGFRHVIPPRLCNDRKKKISIKK